MDRRTFVALFLAGCADPSTDLTPAVSPLPAAPTPAAPLPVTPVTSSGDPGFDAWARDFYARAVQAGLPPGLLDRELTGLLPDPRVTGLDTRQPEFATPFSD